MNQETAGEKFQQLVAIMARLRAPGGCPWDREQTFDSIKPFTLEETYEVLDAIELKLLIDNKPLPEKPPPPPPAAAPPPPAAPRPALR